MPSNIFDLDPDLARLLSVESFQGKFDVRAFVEQLGARQVGLQKRNPGEGFDPKPLIRDFETAYAKLQKLRQDLDADVEKEAREVEVSEAQHAKRVRQLSQKFENVVGTFSKLEDAVQGVGTAPIQLGKQLEALSSQLTRAQAASRVVSTYLNLRENERALQEQYRGSKVSVENALFVRNLMQICRDVEIEGSAKTRTIVESFVESIEREVLEEFEKAREEEDLVAMAHCAKVMYEYNGGNSVNRAFVNQHRFFLRGDLMEAEEQLGANEIWQTLPDPDAELPPLEPSIIVLFREVKRVCKNEFPLINRIFPAPATVKGIFLERIYAQLVQQRLEELLNFAENQSTLAYLRTLQSSHEVLGALIDSIKALPGASPEDSQAVANVLDTAFADLFIPYLEGGRYIEKEKKSLSELYSSVLYKFTRYHQQNRAKKSNYLDRVIDKVGQGEGRVGTLMRLAGIERKGSIGSITAAKTGDIEVALTEEDGELKPDNVKRMLKWHAEAVGRAMELGSGNEVPKDAQALLQALIDYVATEYLEVWLDRALDDLPSPGDLRVEPSLSWFDGVRDGVRIAKLMLNYIDLVIVPMAGSNLPAKRDISSRVTSTTNRVNGRINAVVSRTVDLILSWCNQILARQKRTDYRPNEDDIDLSTMQTASGVQLSAFLANVGRKASDTLSGGNLTSFLTEVGTRVHLTLLEHYKRFQVNATGGLLLTKDISSLQQVVESWNIQSLSQRYQLLHEIGNIFIVKPDVLRGLVTEGELAGISPRLLLPYFQCREDYTAEGIARILGSLQSPTAANGGGGEGGQRSPVDVS